MLKLTQAENKRFQINMAGIDFGLQELVPMKQEILRKIAAESNPDKIEELSLDLTQINSAIKSITSAETAVMETKAEIDAIASQQRMADLQAAAEGQRSFQADCSMITNLVLARADFPAPSTDVYEMDRWHRELADPYLRNIMEKLSYEGAAKQVEEIYVAAKEKRPWNEVINLPTPQPRRAAARGEY